MQHTYTAFTIVPSEALAYALSEHLELMSAPPTGVGTFEIEDGSGLWEIGAYFSEAPDETALAVLAKLYQAKPFEVSQLDDKDWVAQVQRELTPVAAGRFFVHGAHDADKLPDSAIGIKMEAAVAFGTGHHGTTRGCLLALQQLFQDGVRPRYIADIGCGTGILSIGAVKLWRCPILATDMDLIAVRTAQENSRANGVHHFIRMRVCTGTNHPLYHMRTYDLVVANILAQPLKRLAPDVCRLVTSGGHVILSGILLRQGQGVVDVYEAWGMRVVHTIKLDGWVTYVLCKQ